MSAKTGEERESNDQYQKKYKNDGIDSLTFRIGAEKVYTVSG